MPLYILLFLLFAPLSDSFSQDSLSTRDWDAMRSAADENPDSIALLLESMDVKTWKVSDRSKSYYLLGDINFRQGREEIAKSNYVSALKWAYQSEDTVLMASINYRLAMIHYRKDAYRLSLDYLSEALKFYTALSDKKGLGEVLSLECAVYQLLGNVDMAISSCNRAIDLLKSESRNYVLVETYISLGEVYIQLKNFEKAKEYFDEASQVAIDLDDNEAISASYNSLGEIALELGDFEEAKTYFEKSIQLDSLSGDFFNLAYGYFNLGRLGFKLGDFETSLAYLELARNTADQYENLELLCKSLLESAKVWAALGDFSKAIQLNKFAQRYAQRIGSGLILSQVYKETAKYYDRVGDFENSLAYFKLYTLENEKLFNLAIANKVAELESHFEFERQKQEIELLKREKEIDALVSNRRALFNMILASGGVVVLIFLLMILNQYWIKSKANKRLLKQNENIEQQKEEISSQRDDILKKNFLLENINGQITDSIEYAKRIQMSLLPDKYEIKKVFPHSFILYQPKDIVSGDFYWYADLGESVLLAIADCTGHGVPGAFMTVLGKSILDQIVYEGNITTPNLIINVLDQRIRQNMKQLEGTSNNNNDGMDLGLCLIHKKKREIKFAGSKIPAYLIHGDTLKEIKADRVPIGSSFVEDKYFNLYEFQYEAGDTLYLSTDGFQDQFGVKTNKKFLKTNFKEYLTKISGLPIAMQEERLKSEWIDWKGEGEQTDDILIIGIRLL